MSKAMRLGRAMRYGSKSRKSKSRGWRGTWEDRLDISKNEADVFALTRGVYDLKGDEKKSAEEDGVEPLAQYHSRWTHPVRNGQKFRQFRCNQDAGDEDCLGCYRREVEDDSRVGNRPMFSFNALHFAIHRLVQKTDWKTGDPLYYEKDSEKHKRGDPILVWKQVKSRKALKEIRSNLDEYLEMGEDGEEDGVCLVRKKYLDVGKMHRNQLIAELEEAAEKHCKCGGHLTPHIYACASCGHELLDIEDTDMDDDELSQYPMQRQRCPSCGHTSFPESRPQCDSCDEPEALSPFDLVVHVRKKGEGKNSYMVVEEVHRLDEYELEDGSSPLEWDEDDDIPVEDEDGNWVYSEENKLKELSENPWDFERVHSPNDHEYVARFLGCPVPRDFEPSTHSLSARLNKKGGGSSSKYSKYKRNVRVDADDEEEEEEVRRPAKKTAKRGKGRRGRGRI